MSTIPSDVASRLQNTADAALRPVAPTQDIADRLSGLVAGDRIMAQIQSLLPNGTYRALINQRAITLALPFSAKAGDSLELLVTESDGKLALAVVGREGSAAQAGGAGESVSATLSRAGQLISALSGNARQAGGNNSGALPLNGNQPLLTAPPTQGKDLLPALQQALTQSGMFYEAHQAEWVAGRLPQAALLQEPQGKLSSPAAHAQAFATAGQDGTEPAATASRGETQAAPRSADNTAAAPTPRAGETPPPPSEASARAPVAPQSGSQLVAPQTQPIVQQQLDALATQVYAWQGQAWPGQDMRWEIEEDGRPNGDEDAAANAWTTRLRLVLPQLGDVEARIRLNGDQLLVGIAVDNDASGERLGEAGDLLRKQLDAVGLTLGGFAVSRQDTEDQSDDQAQGNHAGPT